MKITPALSYLVGFVLLLSSYEATFAAAKKKPPGRKAKPAPSTRISRDPYIGAIVVDGASGRVLLDDNAYAKGYPASVIKLMDLLIILEKVKEGALKLTDTVLVIAEAAKIGGSQAYLKEKEAFSIDELLYALMVKSANDAAAALAVHVAGSGDAFVDLMNRKAQELGMRSTRFYSVHGLPPGRGKPRDESTAYDLTILGREVLKYPDTLRYTATKNRAFRNGTFTMNNHNNLLGVLEGCDGLKTGFFFEAGFSIVATAQRNNGRVIAVVLGSESPRTRDRKAKEFLTKGFLMLPPQRQTETAMGIVSEFLVSSPWRKGGNY